jgi:hypothetical protein
VDIGIVSLVIMCKCIQYRLWFLSGRSIVKINQGMTVYFLVKYGKKALDGIDLDGHGLEITPESLLDLGYNVVAKGIIVDFF